MKNNKGSEKDKMIRLINIYASFDTVYENYEYTESGKLRESILYMIKELKKCRNLKNKSFKIIYEDLKSTCFDKISLIRESFI